MIPGPGNSVCYRYSLKKEKNKERKKTEGKERKEGRKEGRKKDYPYEGLIRLSSGFHLGLCSVLEKLDYILTGVKGILIISQEVTSSKPSLKPILPSKTNIYPLNTVDL